MATDATVESSPTPIEENFYRDATTKTNGASPAPPAEDKKNNSETPVDKTGAVETEAASEPADHETEPEDDKGKSPRLSWRELRTSREKAEREAAAWRAKYELLEQQAKERNQKAESLPAKPDAKSGKPKEEDYATFGEYLDARDAWNRMDWEEKQAEKQRQADEAKQKAKAEEETKAQQAKWHERAAESRKAHKDFDSVAYSDQVQISPAMHAFLMKSTIGPEILFALGSDLKEDARIMQLDPIEAIRELTKLETALLAKAEAAKGSTPHITKAPRPAPDISGVAAGSPRELSIEEKFYGAN